MNTQDIQQSIEIDICGNSRIMPVPGAAAVIQQHALGGNAQIFGLPAAGQVRQRARDPHHAELLVAGRFDTPVRED